MTEFKTGDPVLIPGRVMGRVVDEGGIRFVAVTTLFDNSIVEIETSLRPDAPLSPYRASTERVEALARVMCEADAVDPDSKASVGQPFLVGSGYVATSEMFAAWRLYAKYAQALLDKGLA